MCGDRDVFVEGHGSDHDVVGSPDLGAELSAVAARAPVPHQDRVDRRQDYVAPVRVDLERRGQVVGNLHLGDFGLSVQPFVGHLFGADHLPRLPVVPADQVAADERAPGAAN